MQKLNTEINNYLESIHEWSEYRDTDLKVKTTQESKPLGSDPKNKSATKNGDDNDDFEFFFKLKSFDPKTKSNQDSDDKNEEEEADDDKEDNDDYDKNNNDDDEEQGQDEFDKMMTNFEANNDAEKQDDEDDYMQEYFSQNLTERTESKDQGASLSVNDLVGSSNVAIIEVELPVQE